MSAVPNYPESPSVAPPLETLSLRDFLSKMIDVIGAMSKSQEMPTEVHLAILKSLQATIHPADEVASPSTLWTTTNSKHWSGSMWIDVLQAGEGCSQRTTIFNMIGYMGASAWFNTQLIV